MLASPPFFFVPLASLTASANSACHLESSVSSGWKLVARRLPCLTATATRRGIEAASEAEASLPPLPPPLLPLPAATALQEDTGVGPVVAVLQVVAV